MGLFDTFKGKQQPKSENIISAMMTTADAAMDKGDYSLAVDTYQRILKLEPNTDAQYNLGSLYAQGKGVTQNYMEAAYWFHQAEMSGDVQAGNLRLKCTSDFVHQNLELKTAEQIYYDMTEFVKYVIGNMGNVNLEVCRNLYGIAGNHFNKHEYEAAAKLFRAAGEFGNDGYSQNYLAVLYNAGAGVEKNDLVALYWFDKAVDNGAEDVSKQDRDGILNAYKANLSKEEFCKIIMTLSELCRTGNDDVPQDAEKAMFWRNVGEA